MMICCGVVYVFTTDILPYFSTYKPDIPMLVICSSLCGLIIGFVVKIKLKKEIFLCANKEGFFIDRKSTRNDYWEFDGKYQDIFWSKHQNYIWVNWKDISKIFIKKYYRDGPEGGKIGSWFLCIIIRMQIMRINEFSCPVSLWELQKMLENYTTKLN